MTESFIAKCSPSNHFLQRMLDHYSFEYNYSSDPRTFYDFPSVLEADNTSQSMVSAQVSHSAIQHLAIRFLWRHKRHRTYIMDIITYLTIIWDSMCVRTGMNHYPISLSALADQNIFIIGITTSIGLDVKIALPEDFIQWKIKLAFHDLHVILPVMKESPPCL